MKVDHQVMDMEWIFHIVECDERQKIMCAFDMLKAEAQNWWRTVIGRGIPITQEQFVEEFNK